MVVRAAEEREAVMLHAAEQREAAVVRTAEQRKAELGAERWSPVMLRWIVVEIAR